MVLREQLGEHAVDEAGKGYWPWVGSSIGGGWLDEAWSSPDITMTLVSRGGELAKAPAGGTAAREMGRLDEGSEAERGQPAAGGKRATEDVRGASSAKLPQINGHLCLRITRAGIPCDLTPGHPDECRPLPRERVSPVGVTEAELAALASTGLVSARPDLSPYNRQVVGVSETELAELAAGWRAARRGAGGGR
jgi:hypothetical protein